MYLPATATATGWLRHWAWKHSNRLFLLKLVHREPSSCCEHNLIEFHLVSICAFNWVLFLHRRRVIVSVLCVLLHSHCVLLRVCILLYISTVVFLCVPFLKCLVTVVICECLLCCLYVCVLPFNRKQQLATIYNFLYSIVEQAQHRKCIISLNRLNYFAIISYCWSDN